MDTTIETFDHAGLTVSIGWEEDSSPFNPREMGDELGTMVCWHPDYLLGDYQLAGGAVETVYETGGGRSDFRSMEVLERYLRRVQGAVCILPLYLLDHSGLAMSAGSNYVGRGDTASGGRDSWGNARGWDTTMVGFIYTTAERVQELCGAPVRAGDAFYCPRDWPADRSAREWVESQLRCEVSTYDSYLQGEVYWYTVENDRGEILDSCGGFLGGGCDAQGRELDPLDYVRQEAREAAETFAKIRRKQRAQRGRALRRSRTVTT